MSGDDQDLIVRDNFDGASVNAALQWYCPPAGTDAVRVDRGLHVSPDVGSDFWRQTYYEPLMVKDNGHLLYATTREDRFVAETSFTLSPVNLFDQAGLVVRLDGEHWLKCGLEYCDRRCQLSVVVTNHGYSDWSKVAYPGTHLTLRVYKQGESYVVEYYDEPTQQWQFIRIAHIDSNGQQEARVGLYCAAPTRAGGSARFDYFQLRRSSGFHHTASSD